MIRKCIVIGILCLLLLTIAPASSAQQTTNGAELKIEQRGLTWGIRNTGDAEVENIIWTFEINIPFIIFGMEHQRNGIDLQPGQFLPIATIFGFGPAEIIITATSNNAAPLDVTFEGLLFGPFLIDL